jgi:Syntaxin 6, N-terminal
VFGEFSLFKILQQKKNETKEETRWNKSHVVEKMSADDPFYLVKEEVEQSVVGITAQFGKWKVAVQSGKDPGLQERLLTEIKTGVRSVEWDLQDLTETIGIVEMNREKFAFDDDELERRKSFLNETNRSINVIKKTLQNPQALLGHQHRTNRNQLLASSSSASGGGVGGAKRTAYSRLDEEIVRDNEGYLQAQMRQQDDIEAQRERYLDELNENVGVIGEMGRQIGDELDVHDGIITDLTTDAERTDGRLRAALRRVEELIDKSSSTTSMVVIVILVLVLIGLIVAVIYI